MDIEAGITVEAETEVQTKQLKGFALIPPERMREIASLGGKAAHAAGTAHKFTSKEAQAAGQKGGATTGHNREHMAAIGRKGGKHPKRRKQPV